MARTFNIVAQLNVQSGNSARLAARQIQSQLQNINATVNVRLGNTTNRSIGLLNRNLNSLLNNLQLVQQAATATTGALSNLAAPLTTVSTNVAALAAASKAATAGITKTSKAAATATTSMTAFGEQSALAVRRFLAFSLAAGAFVGVISGIKRGVSAAIEFERELIKVAQVTGRSVKGLQALTDEITRLSTTLGVASSDLVDISRILAQTGLSARDTRVALETLAQTALAPTFKDIGNTAEGAIAIMRQFGVSADQLGGKLGSINALAGGFAVEAEDLVFAVRRAGGAFKAAGGSLEELLALFTSVRSTTRESAETIATGFRTIFTRIQRPSTIKFLRETGIELTNLQGNFIGPFEAVKRLSIALRQLESTDPRFQSIIEELGGFRQVSKVIPLIQQFGEAQKALLVAQRGQGSLATDAAKAQQTLAVQISKVREQFLALFRDLSNDAVFRGIITATLKLAENFVKILEAAKPLLPILAGIATVGLFKVGAQFAGGFARQFSRAGPTKLASGGIVPGSGSGDTVPAMLTPGEFVIRKSAVQAYGAGNIAGLNRGGRIKRKKFAAGGPIKDFGLIGLQPINKTLDADTSIDFSDIINSGEFKKTGIKLTTKSGKASANTLIRRALDIKSGTKVPIKVIGETVPDKTEKDFSNIIDNRLLKVINDTSPEVAKALDVSNIRTAGKKSFQNLGLGAAAGLVFEGIIGNLGAPFGAKDGKDFPIDFPRGLGGNLGKVFTKLTGRIPTDAKRTIGNEQLTKSKFLGQIANFYGSLIGGSQQAINVKKLTSKTKKSTRELSSFQAESVGLPVNAKARASAVDRLNTRQRLATVSGIRRNKGGTVPALLTPGEMVIGADDASRIGLDTLNAVNTQQFAVGGRVGDVSRKRRLGNTPQAKELAGRRQQRQARRTFNKQVAAVYDFDDTLVTNPARETPSLSAFRGAKGVANVNQARTTSYAAQARADHAKGKSVFVLTARTGKGGVRKAINRFYRENSIPVRRTIFAADILNQPQEGLTKAQQTQFNTLKATKASVRTPEQNKRLAAFKRRQKGQGQPISSPDKKAKILSTLAGKFEQVEFFDDDRRNIIKARQASPKINAKQVKVPGATGSGQFRGKARGGPISRFNRGGVVRKFAPGGAVKGKGGGIGLGQATVGASFALGFANSLFKAESGLGKLSSVLQEVLLTFGLFSTVLSAASAKFLSSGGVFGVSTKVAGRSGLASGHTTLTTAQQNSPAAGFASLAGAPAAGTSRRNRGLFGNARARFIGATNTPGGRSIAKFNRSDKAQTGAIVGIGLLAAGLLKLSTAAQKASDKILETATTTIQLQKAIDKKRNADILSGAGTGAGIGGGIGFLFGPIGAAIGAVAGGLIGAAIGQDSDASELTKVFRQNKLDVELKKLDDRLKTASTKGLKLDAFNIGEITNRIDAGILNLRSAGSAEEENNIQQQLAGRLPQINQLVEQLLALATSTGSADTAFARFQTGFGGAGNKLIQQIAILTNSSVADVTKSLKEQAELTRKLTEAEKIRLSTTAALNETTLRVKAFSDSLATATDKLSQISSVTSTITAFGGGDSPSTLGLTSSDIIGRAAAGDSVNLNDLEKAIRRVAPTKDIAKEALSSAKLLQELPQILISAVNNSGLGKDKLETALKEAGVDESSQLGKLILSGIGEAITKRGKGGESNVRQEILADPVGFAKTLFGEAGTTLLKELDVITQTIVSNQEKIASILQARNQLEIKLVNNRLSTLGLRSNQASFERRTIGRDREKTLAEIQAEETNRRRAIGGGLNVTDISKSLQTAQQRRIRLQQRSDDVNSGAAIGSLNKLTESIKNTDAEIDKYNIALKTIAGSTTRLSELQSKLATQEARRAVIFDKFTSLTFGSREDKQNLVRDVRASVVASRTGDISGFRDDVKSGLFSFLKDFKDIQNETLFGKNKAGEVRKGGDLLKALVGQDFVKQVVPFLRDNLISEGVAPIEAEKQAKAQATALAESFLTASSEEEETIKAIKEAFTSMITANEALGLNITTNMDRLVKEIEKAFKVSIHAVEDGNIILQRGLAQTDINIASKEAIKANSEFQAAQDLKNLKTSGGVSIGVSVSEARLLEGQSAELQNINSLQAEADKLKRGSSIGAASAAPRNFAGVRETGFLPGGPDAFGTKLNKFLDQQVALTKLAHGGNEEQFNINIRNFIEDVFGDSLDVKERQSLFDELSQFANKKNAVDIASGNSRFALSRSGRLGGPDINSNATDILSVLADKEEELQARRTNSISQRDKAIDRVVNQTGISKERIVNIVNAEDGLDKIFKSLGNISSTASTFASLEQAASVANDSVLGLTATLIALVKALPTTDEKKDPPIPGAIAAGTTTPIPSMSGGIIPSNFGVNAGGFSQGTDTRLAALTPGEFIINRRATAQNRGLLEAINSGDIQHASKGGMTQYLQSGGRVIEDHPFRTEKRKPSSITLPDDQAIALDILDSNTPIEVNNIGDVDGGLLRDFIRNDQLFESQAENVRIKEAARKDKLQAAARADAQDVNVKRTRQGQLGAVRKANEPIAFRTSQADFDRNRSTSSNRGVVGRPDFSRTNEEIDKRVAEDDFFINEAAPTRLSNLVRDKNAGISNMFGQLDSDVQHAFADDDGQVDIKKTREYLAKVKKIGDDAVKEALEQVASDAKRDYEAAIIKHENDFFDAPDDASEDSFSRLAGVRSAGVNAFLKPLDITQEKAIRAAATAKADGNHPGTVSILQGISSRQALFDKDKGELESKVSSAKRRKNALEGITLPVTAGSLRGDLDRADNPADIVRALQSLQSNVFEEGVDSKFLIKRAQERAKLMKERSDLFGGIGVPDNIIGDPVLSAKLKGLDSQIDNTLGKDAARPGDLGGGRITREQAAIDKNRRSGKRGRRQSALGQVGLHGLAQGQARSVVFGDTAGSTSSRSTSSRSGSTRPNTPKPNSFKEFIRQRDQRDIDRLDELTETLWKRTLAEQIEFNNLSKRVNKRRGRAGGGAPVGGGDPRLDKSLSIAQRRKIISRQYRVIAREELAAERLPNNTDEERVIRDAAIDASQNRRNDFIDSLRSTGRTISDGQGGTMLELKIDHELEDFTPKEKSEAIRRVDIARRLGRKPSRRDLEIKYGSGVLGAASADIEGLMESPQVTFAGESKEEKFIEAAQRRANTAAPDSVAKKIADFEARHGRKITENERDNILLQHRVDRGDKNAQDQLNARSNRFSNRIFGGLGLGTDDEAGTVAGQAQIRRDKLEDKRIKDGVQRNEASKKEGVDRRTSRRRQRQDRVAGRREFRDSRHTPDVRAGFEEQIQIEERGQREKDRQTRIDARQAEIDRERARRRPLRRQTGGPVPGQGFGDHVKIMAEPGEFVLSRQAVAGMGGTDRLSAINSSFTRQGMSNVAGHAQFGGGVTGPGGQVKIDFQPLEQSFNTFSATFGQQIAGLQSALSGVSFDSLKMAMDGFGSRVGELVSGLASIPTDVNHKLSGDLNVNINGIEVLSSLDPKIREMVNNAVKASMASQLAQARDGRSPTETLA